MRKQASKEGLCRFTAATKEERDRAREMGRVATAASVVEWGHAIAAKALGPNIILHGVMDPLLLRLSVPVLAPSLRLLMLIVTLIAQSTKFRFCPATLLRTKVRSLRGRVLEQLHDVLRLGIRTLQNRRRWWIRSCWKERQKREGEMGRQSAKVREREFKRGFTWLWTDSWGWSIVMLATCPAIVALERLTHLAHVIVARFCSWALLIHTKNCAADPRKNWLGGLLSGGVEMNLEWSRRVVSEWNQERRRSMEGSARQAVRA